MELREAIKIVRRDKNEVTWNGEMAKTYKNALNVLLNLAESVFASKGMPEKKVFLEYVTSINDTPLIYHLEVISPKRPTILSLNLICPTGDNLLA